jgi:hypothetical protein
MNPAHVEMDRRSPMGVRISGVGAEIPPRVVSTAELEEQADIGRFGFEPGWLERVTAVRERRWAEPDAILGTQPTLGRHPRRAAAVHRRQLKPRGLWACSIISTRSKASAVMSPFPRLSCLPARAVVRPARRCGEGGERPSEGTSPFQGRGTNPAVVKSRRSKVKASLRCMERMSAKDVQSVNENS